MGLAQAISDGQIVDNPRLLGLTPDAIDRDETTSGKVRCAQAPAAVT